MNGRIELKTLPFLISLHRVSELYEFVFLPEEFYGASLQTVLKSPEGPLSSERKSCSNVEEQK